MARQETKAPASVFDVGTHLLTDISVNDIRIRKRKVLNIDKQLRTGTGDRLIRCIENFCRNKGIEISTKSIRKTKDIQKIIKEIREKHGLPMSLYTDEDGTINFGNFHSAMDEYTLYHIPFGTTYSMREETGLLARRFVKAFAEKFKIGTITATGEYDYQLCIYDEYLTELKEGKETYEEFDDQAKQTFQEYIDGEIKDCFDEYATLTPLTPEELDDFVPETDAEKHLKEVFLDGFAVMRTDTDLWTLRNTDMMNEKELQEFTNDGYIDLDTILCVVYDRDDAMMAAIQDSLNGQIQAGYGDEYIINGGILPETGTGNYHDDVNRIFNYIDKLNGELENTKLLTSTFKKPAT